MTRKVYIKSYGCQMNVYDSDRMAELLAPAGYDAVDGPEGADLVILNTCHIREKAAEKVYSEIGRLRALKAEKAADGGAMTLAVAGCVAQAEGAEIMRRAPAVDLVFGPQTYHRLPELLDQVEAQRARGGAARVLDTDFPAEAKFEALPGRSAAGPATDPRLSAFLTVQEGCDKFCTFCVVPYTRGAEFSRPVADVEAEARQLAAAGVREITLLGQNVNAYHGAMETGDALGLGGLIHRLAEIDGLARIRYTTSHPRDMGDDLIRTHADVPQCMPYLHLPVQSGSDRILKAMNRGHDAAAYRRIVERLRAARPDIALSGDFIVGFPGEREADFEATLALVREVGYAQAYSFKYSPRPGTPAADMDDQVPEAVKAERLAALQELLNAQQRAFNEATVGRRMPVLIERAGRDPGQVAGRSPYMQAVHVALNGQAPARPARRNDVDPLAAGRAKQHIGDEAGIPEQIPGLGLIDVEIMAAGPNSLEGRPAAPGAEVSGRS